MLQASAIHAQDLGHKLPGGIGLDAGKAPPEPGFYLVDRFVTYDADQVRDRRGDVVPVKGLRIGVLANGFGVAWAFELPRLATRASVTVAAACASQAASGPAASGGELVVLTAAAGEACTFDK